MDIFSLAVTEKQILSAGGTPAIKIHSTTDPEFPLVQSIDHAHDIGCHHIVTDGKGTRAASAGFDGKIKIWSCQDGYWAVDEKLSGRRCPSSIISDMLTRKQPTWPRLMPGPLFYL
jgi:superkiller protein 8